MSHLERLTEALDDVDEIYSYIKGDYFDEKWGLGEKAERVKGLLRAYRDLLANGERVWPDYVAGMRVLMELAGEVPVLDFNDPTAGAAFVAAVDAAIDRERPDGDGGERGDV